MTFFILSAFLLAAQVSAGSIVVKEIHYRDTCTQLLGLPECAPPVIRDPEAWSRCALLATSQGCAPSAHAIIDVAAATNAALWVADFSPLAGWQLIDPIAVAKPSVVGPCDLGSAKVNSGTISFGYSEGSLMLNFARQLDITADSSVSVSLPAGCFVDEAVFSIKALWPSRAPSARSSTDTVPVYDSAIYRTYNGCCAPTGATTTSAPTTVGVSEEVTVPMVTSTVAQQATSQLATTRHGTVTTTRTQRPRPRAWLHTTLSIQANRASMNRSAPHGRTSRFSVAEVIGRACGMSFTENSDYSVCTRYCSAMASKDSDSCEKYQSAQKASFPDPIMALDALTDCVKAKAPERCAHITRDDE